MAAYDLNVNREDAALGILRNLDRRREEGDHDFTIIVEGKKILAEKNVLISASDYFKAMLNTKMKESQSGQVTMYFVDYESVNTCINYIYGRPVSVLRENFEKLIYVANMLHLKGLCEAIEAKIGETLEISQFFSIIAIAIMYSCTTLMNECKHFAFMNFEALSEDEDFNSLHKAFLKDLVTSKLNVASEETKLEVILSWVKHDEQRRGDLLELLKCIDFTQVSIQFGREIIAYESLINETNECLLYVSSELLASVPERETSFPYLYDDRPHALPYHRRASTPEQEAERDLIDRRERLRYVPFQQPRGYPHQPGEGARMNAVPVDAFDLFQLEGHWWPRGDEFRPINPNPYLPHR